MSTHGSAVSWELRILTLYERDSVFDLNNSSMKVTQLCLKIDQVKRDASPLFLFLRSASPKTEQRRAGLQQVPEND